MIRARIENSVKQLDEYIDNISASIGVAQLQPGRNEKNLIHRADQALYSAKQNGQESG